MAEAQKCSDIVSAGRNEKKLHHPSKDKVQVPRTFFSYNPPVLGPGGCKYKKVSANRKIKGCVLSENEKRCLLPDYKTVLPDYKRMLPEYETVLPEYKTVLPDYETVFLL